MNNLKIILENNIGIDFLYGKSKLIENIMDWILNDFKQLEIVTTQNIIHVEHTPKNIMIRGIKKKKLELRKEKSSQKYLELKEFLQIEPTLEKLPGVDLEVKSK